MGKCVQTFDWYCTCIVDSSGVAGWVESLTSLIRLAIYKAVRGVCSATFITTVLPVARAGPSFQACISKGKFHLGAVQVQRGGKVRRSEEHTSELQSR